MADKPDKIYNPLTKRWVNMNGKKAKELKQLHLDGAIMLSSNNATKLGIITKHHNNNAGPSAPPKELNDLNANAKRSVLSKMNNNTVRFISKVNKSFSTLAIAEKHKRNETIATEKQEMRARAQAQNTRLHGNEIDKIRNFFKQHYQLTTKLKIRELRKDHEDKAGQVIVQYDNGDEDHEDWEDDFIAYLARENIPYSFTRAKKGLAHAVFDAIKNMPNFVDVRSGDIVRFDGGYRNRRVIGIYDGKSIIPLDYEGYEEGIVPDSFVVFEHYPPMYWTDVIEYGEYVRLNLRLRTETVSKLAGIPNTRYEYLFTKKNTTCKIVFHSDYNISEKLLKDTLMELPLLVEVFSAQDLVGTQGGFEYMFMKEIYQEKPRNSRSSSTNNGAKSQSSLHDGTQASSSSQRKRQSSNSD